MITWSGASTSFTHHVICPIAAAAAAPVPDSPFGTKNDVRLVSINVYYWEKQLISSWNIFQTQLNLHPCCTARGTRVAWGTKEFGCTTFARQARETRSTATVHCPDARQVPVLAHGEEHAMDWISVRLSEPPTLESGSCTKSGIESQTIIRLFDDVRAAHVFSVTRKDPGGTVVVVQFGPADSWVKVDWPWYSDWGYERTPCCRATVKGRDGFVEGTDEFENPDERKSDACWEGSTSCNRASSNPPTVYN